MRITLNLDETGVATLIAVCQSIGGCPQRSPRGRMGNIQRQIEAQLPSPDEHKIQRMTNQILGLADQPEFGDTVYFRKFEQE